MGWILALLSSPTVFALVKFHYCECTALFGGLLPLHVIDGLSLPDVPKPLKDPVDMEPPLDRGQQRAAAQPFNRTGSVVNASSTRVAPCGVNVITACSKASHALCWCTRDTVNENGLFGFHSHCCVDIATIKGFDSAEADRNNFPENVLSSFLYSFKGFEITSK